MFTRIESATLEDIEKKNPDVFAQIKELGKQEQKAEDDVKITELEGKVKEHEEKEQKIADNKIIQETADKFGLSERGKELIEQNVSVNEALATLAREATGHKDMRSDFANTASQLAGDGKADETESQESVKTRKDAKDFCKKKYGCTNKEAWHHAKEDFPQLFNADFNNVTRKEV